MTEVVPKCSDYTDCNTCSTGYPSSSNGVCYWCPNASGSKCVDPDEEKDKFNDNQATCSRDCSPTDASSNQPVNDCSMIKECGTCTNTLIPNSDGGYCSWNSAASSCSAFDDTGNILHGGTCPTTTPTSCKDVSDCATCSGTKIGNDACAWDSVFNKCDLYANTVNVSTSCEVKSCSSNTTEPLCTSSGCLWDASTNLCGQPSVPNNEMSLEDMLAYLANLQKLEEKLYKLLTQSAQNITSGVGGMTQAEIDIIVEQINGLSMQRSQLYTAVAAMYNDQAQYEDRMGITIGQQITTLKLLEKEMNKSKQQLQNSKDEKIKTMKMVEINTYFSHEYAEYTYLMKIVALIAALLLGCTFLNDYSPGMSGALFQLISYLGGAYVLYILIDIMQRRNTKFDEYTFPTAPTTDAGVSSANETGEMVLDVSGIDIDLCAGSYCCSDGTEWKDNYGCVPSPI
jgi:hypothetical protein